MITFPKEIFLPYYIEMGLCMLRFSFLEIICVTIAIMFRIGDAVNAVDLECMVWLHGCVVAMQESNSESGRQYRVKWKAYPCSLKPHAPSADVTSRSNQGNCGRRSDWEIGRHSGGPRIFKEETVQYHLDNNPLGVCTTTQRPMTDSKERSG